MNARTSAIVLSLILAVGACKSKQQAATSGKDGGAQVSDAATTIDAAADAPEAVDAAGGLSGRADGVGPLDEKFVVSNEALKAAFPGFAVARVSDSQGGELLQEFWAIKKDGQDVLHVQAEGEDIEAVDIVGGDVPNPLGVKIGATYAEVAKALGKLYCENAGDAVDWRADVVQCSSDKADNWTLDFVSPEADDAKAMLADPAKLAKATVRAVTWRVPVPGPGQ
jgi:hypothetical protein